jgi:hypothetical protein
MLKNLFWLLLAINGVLFASGRGLLFGQSAERAEPQRLVRQLNAEQLVLAPLAAQASDGGGAVIAPSTTSENPALPAMPATLASVATPAIPAIPASPSPLPLPAAAEARPAASPAASSAVVPPSSVIAAARLAGAGAAAATAVTATAPTVAAPVPAAALPGAVSATVSAVTPVQKLLACIDIGNFDPNEARAFRARLSAARIDAQPAQRSVPEVASYMVYIAAYDGRDGAERKAAELRRLGIADFYIMPDTSPMRDAVSLGLFKTEAAAKAYVGQLIPKGVRSARIIERTASTNKVAFRLRDLNGADQARFAALAAAFPNQSRRDCSG